MNTGKTIMSLLVELGADTGDFDTGMSGAEQKSKKSSNNIVNNMGAIGGAALAAGGAIVAGIGAALIKTGLDAAPLQSIKTSFDLMAEAAGSSGNAVLEAMQKGSAGMIANADLMKSYNQATQLISAEFAGQLPDAMKYLSKVSAATGKDMTYLMDSLVTGVGRMSPMILDNLSIQVSEADATARAAEMYGVEADQLSKAQKQAGMMAVVLEKLQQNTAALPDITGTAAQGLAAFGTTLKNLKDRIGLAVLPAISEFVDVLNNKLSSPKAQMFIDSLITSISGVSTIIVDKIPDIINWIGQAIGFLENNEGVVIGILAAIGSAIGVFIYSTVIPAIVATATAIAPVLAIMAAVGAVAYLVYQAWTNNWGGIRDTMTGLWNETLMPMFTAISTWMQTNIPVAIQFLSDAWNNTLLPALTAVWTFLQSYIFPIFSALGELVGTYLTLEFTVIAGVWQNIILPALDAIWKVIKENVVPAISSLADWVGGHLAPAFDWLKDALVVVCGWIDSLTAKLASISIPDWLMPGSPTPFEIGLRGIASAMSELSRSEIPEFAAKLALAPEPIEAVTGLASVRVSGATSVASSSKNSESQPDYRDMLERILFKLDNIPDAMRDNYLKGAA